jgi:antitoxin Phd
MSRLSASLARTQLPEAINQVAYGGERVTIHRRGKEVAALVSIEDLALLQKMEDKLDAEAAIKAKKSKGASIPLHEVLAKAGLR